MDSDNIIERKHYQIFLNDILGRGAFGIVYSSVNLDTDEPYAIKLIQRSSYLKYKSLVDREVHILQQVRKGENIIHLYDFFEDETGDVFLVFEFADGGTLLTLLNNCYRLLEEEARPLFLQVANGLQQLHAKGIVHGDIKLDNILLFAKDEIACKIADFGFARLESEGNPQVNTRGSPAYMAPEATRGSAYDGFKADIWSLGVTLYIMVFSTFPFHPVKTGPTIQEEILDLFVQVRTKEPRYDLYPISPQLLHLFSRMFQKNPLQRATISEILNHPWCLEQQNSMNVNSANTVEDANSRTNT